MPRIKSGVIHARKRKRVLKAASGFVGGPGDLYRPALEFTRKAAVYAYRHRKQKKRTYRSIWITRLNAALKIRDIHYNRFIPALASWYGASICEVPIKNVNRERGKSHYGIGRTFRVFFDLLTIRFLLKYMTRPLHFFGGFEP